MEPLMVKVLLFNVSAFWETTKQGCVVSVPEVAPPQVRVMEPVPKLAPPDPTLSWASSVPTVVPVPEALKPGVAVLPAAQGPDPFCAVVSKVAPAAMLTVEAAFSE